MLGVRRALGSYDSFIGCRVDDQRGGPDRASSAPEAMTCKRIIRR